MAKRFVQGIFLVCVLLMTPLLVASSKIDQIESELTQTKSLDKRFYLHKELFALKWKDYCLTRGSADQFIEHARIAYFEKEGRQKCLDLLDKEEKKLFEAYDSMITLGNQLGVHAVSKNSMCGLGQSQGHVSESYQLYFLQILALEDEVKCPILGKELFILQMIDFTSLLQCLETDVKLGLQRGLIKDRHIGNITMDYASYRFYWKNALDLCHELLESLENRWKDFEYNREKILNLVFMYRFSIAFPYPESEPDPIERFLPYILKYSSLDLVRDRFNDMNENADAWDANLNWVKLHLTAARQLSSSDPEKATDYLDKAKALAKDTLWCYSFSCSRAHWNRVSEEAAKLIAAYEN